ncbi:hypothetical protein GEMRC1_011800 [Eukaryota sp. GEM-RC1]
MSFSPLASPRSKGNYTPSPIPVRNIASHDFRSLEIPPELYNLLSDFVDDFTSSLNPPENALAYTVSYFTRKYSMSLLQSGISCELRLDILTEIYQHLRRSYTTEFGLTVIDKRQLLDLAEVCGLPRASATKIIDICRSNSKHSVDYEEFVLCSLIVKDSSFDSLIINLFSVYGPPEDLFPSEQFVTALTLLKPLVSSASYEKLSMLLKKVEEKVARGVSSFRYSDVCSLLKQRL